MSTVDTYSKAPISVVPFTLFPAKSTEGLPSISRPASIAGELGRSFARFATSKVSAASVP